MLNLKFLSRHSVCLIGFSFFTAFASAVAQDDDFADITKQGKYPSYQPVAKDSSTRFQEGLKFIIEKMVPDDSNVDAKIASRSPESVKKLGIDRWKARLDRGPDYALACLAVGENVAAANAYVVRWARDYAVFDPKEKLPVGGAGETNPRTIFRIRLLPSCYKNLSKEAKDAIDDSAFAYCNKMSNIDPKAPLFHNAAAGPWAMSNSENHDAGDKIAILLGLQILDCSSNKYNSQTKLADGQTVQENYDAWVSYWKENIRQRAREGLFSEIAHHGAYGQATNGTYLDIYDVAVDPVLKRLAGDMLTLHFTQLATEYEPKTGARGAFAQTRAKGSEHQEFGSHWTKNLTFAFGWGDAHGTHLVHSESQLFTTTWRPPAIVTAIARGPRLPPYFSVMRNFGLGGEKVDSIDQILFADGSARNSYIRRTAWVAPEYMLSGISVDPNREYLQVNTQGRLAGISFSSGVNDRIAIYGNAADGHVGFSEINTQVSKDCLIVGRMPQATSSQTLVYVSGGRLWSSRVEDPSGWQFFNSGDGFCALRIAGPFSIQDAPHKVGYVLALKDIDAPIVIQSGRAIDYPGGFKAFKDAVLTKPRFDCSNHALTYTSLDGDICKFWTKEKKMPEINGHIFNLNPEDTYSSPYLSMVHGTNKATIKYPGFDNLILDFSY